MQTVANMVSLVSGIPGVGKSEFCRVYLRDIKGWLHLDIDWLVGTLPWPNAKLQKAWEAATRSCDPNVFVQACTESGNVVIDWGFPISWIPFVRFLANDGVKVLWFDGDVETARIVFERRGTVLISAFDRQLNDLRSMDVPGEVGAKVIRVLDKGPQFMAHQEIYRIAFE